MVVHREKDLSGTIAPWPPKGLELHETYIERYDPGLSPLVVQELLRIVEEEIREWRIPTHEEVMRKDRGIHALGQTEERSRELFGNWRDFCEAVIEGRGMILAEIKGEETSGDRDNIRALTYAMNVLGADYKEWEEQISWAGRAFSALLGEGEMEEGDQKAAVELVEPFADYIMTSSKEGLVDRDF